MGTENPKNHLIQLVVGTILFLFSLLAIVLYTDPYSAGVVTHILFYLSLWFAVTGVFSIVGLGIRRSLSHELYIVSFWIAFRQGVLIALLAVSLLILRSQDLLHWWILLVLVLFLLAIELFFST